MIGARVSLEPAVEDRRGPGQAARSGPSVGTAILGAGPAGLSAAYVFAARGRRATVLEADECVGGISRTVESDGYRFDLGGHRFYTKLAPVQRLWEETLGEEFLVRPRLSRIYYGGRFFAYPLRAADVVSRLGLVETLRCGLSYVAGRLRRRREEPRTFEDWVVARFGRRMYDTFFRSYTHKVWGIPGSQIQAEWAAQRIKDFSFLKAFSSALRLDRGRDVVTLIERFHYPRLGPGQLWERVAERVADRGVGIELGARCVSVRHDGRHVRSVVVETGEGRGERAVDAVVSSMALRDLVLALDPPAPPDVLEAARRLRYRDLMVVGLVIDDEEPFPDNWIYLHDPNTRAGRVQNYGAWSPDMVRPGTTCLGVEYFCFRGDDLWELPEEEAVRLAAAELAAVGLVDQARVVRGLRIHVPLAYPMYDAGYDRAVEVVRAHLAEFANLQTCGRNGLHRYNNQDHSMWTGILAALNVVDGAVHDVWSVNVDSEYLEAGEAVDELVSVPLA